MAWYNHAMRKTKIAVTDETRAKLKAAQLRYLKDHPHQNLGSRHSPEIRKKMSEIATARNAALREAGIPHPNVGHKVSEEQKEKQRKTMLGHYAGAKNPAWRVCPHCGKHLDSPL